jgi:hypothetical protein
VASAGLSPASAEGFEKGLKMDNDIALQGFEDTQRALLALLESLRRSLQLYTPHLDARLYNESSVLDAIRTQVIENPRTRFQLIIPPAESWRRACPHFLQLSQRLSSALELRTLAKGEPRERQEFSQSFLIADEHALLLLADPYRLVGSYAPQTSGKTKELLNFFQQIWEKSEPDPELRQLRI